MASTVTDKVKESGIAIKDWGIVLLNTYVPPSQRDELSQALRGWVAQNPKLAAFLISQVILSGPPLLIFLAFSTTIFISSLLVCILTAFAVALAFTTLSIGLALLLLLPTLFVTTMSAIVLFATGLVARTAISKFNNDPRTEGLRSKAKSNVTAVGNKVKDASNGSVDLNTAAQQVASSALSLGPAHRSSEEAASEERAKQYLARQALGIPEQLDHISNGSMRIAQDREDHAIAIEHANGSYLQTPANSATLHAPEKLDSNVNEHSPLVS